jgi:ribosomal protein S18 acetylase RimI-like enzyme
MFESLTIARVESTDLGALTNLINNAYRGEAGGWTSEGAYLEGKRTTLADMETLFVQPDLELFKCFPPNGDVLGIVSFQYRPDDLYLSLLSVAPEWQDRGIGRKLLDFAETHARSLQKQAILITVLHIRTELISWYERRGYIITGNTKPFPIEAGKPRVAVHLVEMRKLINYDK